MQEKTEICLNKRVLELMIWQKSINGYDLTRDDSGIRGDGAVARAYRDIFDGGA